MSFADPQPVTIAAATKNLVRVSGPTNGVSEYRLVEALQSFQMYIRSQNQKTEADGRRKVRHNISIRQTVFATATVGEITRDASVTLTHYEGDDITLVDDVFIAAGALCTAGNALKLNNFES